VQPDFLSRLQDRVIAQDDRDLALLLHSHARAVGLVEALARQLRDCENRLELAKKGNRLVCAQRDDALTQIEGGVNSPGSLNATQDRSRPTPVGSKLGAA
jgi:hypothetical protein